ncbi:MAG TPA: signal recognition particle-docking protein FtsY [Spirochaetota bacterium]|nr:signal recognition particle-docking protein FtsY [Spirochaetota bacterium]
MGFFGKKDKEKNEDKKDYFSQTKNKQTLGQKLRKIFGGKVLDATSLDELEETLITADIGPKITSEIIEKLKTKNIGDIEEAILFLKEELKKTIVTAQPDLKRNNLNIILVLGVNGVGKTTTIAKLANFYIKEGYKTMVAAGDTFRAAATEQLTKWAERLDIPIVKQGEGADPASVVFDAVDSAKAKGIEILIVDTAGRLHTKINLMEELKKIDKIISNKGNFEKKNLLVIDATTGQNAYVQTESFKNAVGVDGIVLTKYDSQGKGGIVFTIQKKLNVPFYFIGTGEKIENIEKFDKDDFVEKIFS